MADLRGATLPHANPKRAGGQGSVGRAPYDFGMNRAEFAYALKATGRWFLSRWCAAITLGPAVLILLARAALTWQWPDLTDLKWAVGVGIGGIPVAFAYYLGRAPAHSADAVKVEAQRRGMTEGEILKWEKYREWLKRLAGLLKREWLETNPSQFDLIVLTIHMGLEKAHSEVISGEFSCAVRQHDPPHSFSKKTLRQGRRYLRDLAATTKPWEINRSASLHQFDTPRRAMTRDLF